MTRSARAVHRGASSAAGWSLLALLGGCGGGTPPVIDAPPPGAGIRAPALAADAPPALVAEAPAAPLTPPPAAAPAGGAPAPEEDVERAAMAAAPALRRCYETGRRKAPALAGVTETRLALDAGGHATAAEDVSEGEPSFRCVPSDALPQYPICNAAPAGIVPDPYVRRCVAAALEQVDYPARGGPTVSVVRLLFGERDLRPARVFDRPAARRALSAVDREVSACLAEGHVSEPVQVVLTFEPSGHVAGLGVPGPLEGSTMHSCIARVFRGVTVPSFDGEAYVVGDPLCPSCPEWRAGAVRLSRIYPPL
jgi:hypothetical protein